jgi:peptide/nickel transport system substrate-binding protein
MKRNYLWLLLATILSVVALLLASCGTSTTTTTTAANTQPPVTASKTTAAPAGPTTTVAASQKPKYGGTFAAAQPSDTALWDPGQGFDLMGFQISITNEALMSGDWAKGPAGTGETDWQYGAVGRPSLGQGLLAESWQIPDNQHLIFHIRKGVKWWNKPPANGREFTADDVVWNIKQQWSIPAGNFQNFFSKPERLIDAVALDKYTVQLTVPPNTQGIHFWEDGQRAYMMLPELFPKQADWHNALGTGPYMVSDYVPGSEITMVRNPSYWQTNPVGPGKGDQLPYLDGMKFFVIPDIYTRESAFRTGKLDIISGVVWEDWQNIMNTMPYKPQYVQTYGANFLPTGREDKNLPFNDVRVRQAMNLAFDKQSIVKDYYQGHAALLGWPYYNTPAYSDLYTPLEQMPADVQELVKGGNVAKAKQLLTDAGYPNGFKTSIYSSNSLDSDFLSIIKAQLAQVNIDLSIKQIDPGVFASTERARSWEEMWYKATKQYFLPHYMFEMRPESNDSAAFWDSTQTRQVYNDINKTMGMDDQVWRKELKDVTPYVLQQSFAIWLPVAYKFNGWQPWIQNYYGASTMSAFQPYHAMDYTWEDAALKSSLGK